MGAPDMIGLHQLLASERRSYRYDRDFGPSQPKPIPESPTDCTACGERLQPTRRYAGLCGPCVEARFGVQHATAPEHMQQGA